MSILPRITTAQSLHGITVVSPSGRRIGELEDIAIGVTTGRVLHAVLALDTPSELGERFYAVPWETLTLDAAHDRCVLNVPVETLRTAPALPTADAIDHADPRLRSAIATHFGHYPNAA